MVKRMYCKVMFPETPERDYTFGTCITGLNPGDPVIVETRNGLAHALFIEYGRAWSNAVKFVVAKTDVSSLDASRHAKWRWCEICGDRLNDDGMCPECTANEEERNRNRDSVVIFD